VNENHQPAKAAGTRVIKVDPESEGQRLDVFLAANISGHSRSHLKRLIEENRVLVDGVSVRASRKIRAGESITVIEPEPRPAEPLAEDIPLNVIHEDRDLIVIDKRAGLVVHPAPGNPDGTLVNALLNHCTDLSGVGGVLRPGIVHRLDRGTSGVLVVSKNDRSHRHLSTQFQKHRVDKCYLAFAARRPGARALADHDRFDTLYGRHPVHRKRFSSRVESGKRAVTEISVLGRFNAEDWQAVKLEIKLVTGRTHQIRVHLSDAGHPLLGDKLYGGRVTRMLPRHVLPDRPALHARSIAFVHPASGERVSFEAPVPLDLTRLEEALRSASR